MEIKKYMDIQRMRDDWQDVFSIGDEIWIEEKIDGANCGIHYDKENDKLVAQSRKRILEVGQDDLREFGAFVERLNVNIKWKKTIVAHIFNDRDDIVLFGEWLVPHTIKYPAEFQKKMYCLRENWDETDMPIVAKNLSKCIVEDCIKEENDTVVKIENFGKAANKVCMGIAKELIKI